jgi:hypothetical protein
MQFNTIAALALSVAFATATGAAFAQDIGKSGKPLTTQQQRMKNCNAEAKAQALKGDERKAFMSTCLKGGSNDLAARDPAKNDAARAPSPKQLKRKACSADAKAEGLKGDERKAFIKECVADEGLASATR